MFVRITKGVFHPDKRLALLDRYRSYIEESLRPAKGNLCVRLFGDRKMHNKCVMISYWDTPEAALSSELTEIRKHLKPALEPFLLERIQAWSLNVIDEDSREPLLNFSESSALRFAKFEVKEDGHEAMLRYYHDITNAFSRKQPGSIAINLYQDTTNKQLYFLESRWTSKAALEAVVKGEQLEFARLKAINEYQQDRMAIWDLKLLDGDDRFPAST